MERDWLEIQLELDSQYFPCIWDCYLSFLNFSFIICKVGLMNFAGLLHDLTETLQSAHADLACNKCSINVSFYPSFTVSFMEIGTIKNTFMKLLKLLDEFYLFT